MRQGGGTEGTAPLSPLSSAYGNATPTCSNPSWVFSISLFLALLLPVVLCQGVRAVPKATRCYSPSRQCRQAKGTGDTAEMVGSSPEGLAIAPGTQLEEGAEMEKRVYQWEAPHRSWSLRGEESIIRSPGGAPPALSPPLSLFALERWEQRPGEPPAAARPPARASAAPLLPPDRGAAPGADLRWGEQESGAGPAPRRCGAASRHRDGARPSQRGAEPPAAGAGRFPTAQLGLRCRSLCTTKRTSRARGWSSPRPARTSWSAASTTSAP